MNSISDILQSKPKLKQNNVNNKYINNVNNVRRIANRISTKLDDYHSISFHYKVAWHLSEVEIEHHLEQASRGHSPKKYFTWLCVQSLNKLQL